MIDSVGARDEIYAAFNVAWQAETLAIVGYIPEVEWQGRQPRSNPVTSKYWCRVSIQNVSENQAAFANSNGERKYTLFGLVYIQLFAPRSAINGFEKCLELAQVAKESLRGKSTPGGIWFRNVRLNELTPEDSFYRLNVVAEFEHDEQG